MLRSLSLCATIRKNRPFTRQGNKLEAAALSFAFCRIVPQATASADFSARLWNAISGEELAQFAHKHIVRTCAFSSDSRRLMTGGQEKLVRLYDLMAPDTEPLVMQACNLLEP